MEIEAISSSRLFKFIWKVRATQRLKGFMWLVMNEALLINNARFRRALIASNTCCIYGIYSKTTLHILRDCDKAKELWFGLR